MPVISNDNAYVFSCPALFISINNINTPSETTNVEKFMFFFFIFYNFTLIFFYINLCKNGATVGYHFFFVNFILAKQILSRHPQQARKLSWLNTKGVCWVGFMVNIITFDWIKLRFMFHWTKKKLYVRNVTEGFVWGCCTSSTSHVPFTLYQERCFYCQLGIFFKFKFYVLRDNYDVPSSMYCALYKFFFIAKVAINPFNPLCMYKGTL